MEGAAQRSEGGPGWLTLALASTSMCTAPISPEAAASMTTDLRLAIALINFAVECFDCSQIEVQSCRVLKVMDVRAEGFWVQLPS